MTLILVAVLVAGVTFGSGMGALYAQRSLPEAMRSDPSRAVVVQLSALLSLLISMVLGTLVGTGFSFFLTQRANLDAFSAQALQLDQALAEYGPETKPIRAQLKEAVVHGHDLFWGHHAVGPAAFSLAAPLSQERGMEALLASLQPTGEGSKQALAKARQFAAAMEQSRLLMSLQLAGQWVPWQLVVIVSFWACVLFFGYGLFAPHNATIITGFALGAMSIGLAIFLIFDLRQPYTGVFRISPGSLEETIEFLNK